MSFPGHLSLSCDAMPGTCTVRLNTRLVPFPRPIHLPCVAIVPPFFFRPRRPPLNRAGQVARTVWVLLDAASRHGLAGVKVPKQRQQVAHEETTSGDNNVRDGSDQRRGTGGGGGCGRGRGRGRGRGPGAQGRGGGSTFRAAGRDVASGDDRDAHAPEGAAGSGCEAEDVDAPEVHDDPDDPADSHDCGAGARDAGETGDTEASGDAAAPAAKACDGKSDAAITADCRTGCGGGHLPPTKEVVAVSTRSCGGSRSFSTQPPKGKGKGTGKEKKEGDKEEEKGERSVSTFLPSKPRMSQVRSQSSAFLCALFPMARSLSHVCGA